MARTRDRLPPVSIDSEMGLLSCMMQSEKCILRAIQEISEEFFFVPAHKIIYKEILGFHNKNGEFNLIAFTEHMLDQKNMADVGGPARITEIFTFVPTVSHFDHYKEIVEDRYQRRIIIDANRSCAVTAYDTSCEDFKEQAGSDFMKVLKILYGTKKPRSIREQVMDTVQSLQDIKDGKKTLGIPTGIEPLDRKSKGLEIPSHILVGAPTSGGKSVLGLNFIKSVAMDHNMCAVLFTLEMSEQEAINRILANMANIELNDIRDADLDEKETIRFLDCSEKIANSKLIIDDNPDINIMQIRAKVRDISLQNDVKLVVVDYIQLVKQLNAKDKTREEMISDIGAELKRMSKEINCCVVGLTQLNEHGKTQYARALEMHTNNYFVIDRMNFEDRMEDAPINTTIALNKMRNDPVGKVDVTFDGKYQRFTGVKKFYHKP